MCRGVARKNVREGLWFWGHFPLILGLFYAQWSSVQDCQSRALGFKYRPGQKFSLRFLLRLYPIANSAMMSTLTIHCEWEDETLRERTGHPPSYTEAKFFFLSYRTVM